jgi:purine-binding chemotaxis protein CheW
MHDGADYTEFVTFTTAGQLFGVPIGRVQDVFKPSRITRVPLAGAVCAADSTSRAAKAIARRSRSASRPRGNPLGSSSTRSAKCSICRTPSAERSRSTSIASSRRFAGVYRLDGHLLVALDIDRVLDLRTEGVAA